MFVRGIGDGVGGDIGTDHGSIDLTGSIAVPVVKSDNQQSIPARLEIRGSQQRRQIGAEEGICRYRPRVVPVTQTVGSDDAELRQRVVRQINGELGKIYDPCLGPSNVT